MADQRTDCQKVAAELEESKKIRAAYADQALLREADEKGWDGNEYNDKVAEKAFPGKRGEAKNKVVLWTNPMYTNPDNCKIIQVWSRKKYLDEGIPEIVYIADIAHEQVHQKSCQPDSMLYRADMSFPKKRSANELKAYDAKIKILQNWLDAKCPAR